MKLDFSQAHFLDHSILDPYCATQYGGRRTHLRYWWDFKAKSDLRSRLFCTFGYHHQVRYWRRRAGEEADDLHKRMRSGQDADGLVCGDCAKKIQVF